MADTDVHAEDKRILANTIQAENAIINQRMGWGLTLQGFLFASYFLSDPAQIPDNALLALGLLGFATSFSTLIGSTFGNIALVSAIKTFETLQTQSGGSKDIRPGRRFGFPGVGFLMPHLFIPAALTAVWGYVVAMQVG